MSNSITEQIEAHSQMVSQIQKKCIDSVELVIGKCVEALKNGRTIYFCGNGGSAADAQHLAAEFVVKFRKNRKALRALALTTDTSALTACGNDFGYEGVFARQLEAFGQEGDIIFLITTSGTSPNMVAAYEMAKKLGVWTVAVTGAFEKGVGPHADYWWRLPSTDTARIQEGYMLLGHLLCDEVETRMFDDE